MEKNKEIKNVIAETYAGDMAEVIENDKGGLVKKSFMGRKSTKRRRKIYLQNQRKINSLCLLVFCFYLLL